MGRDSPLKPPALAPGDLLGIVAPASGIDPELLAAGVHELERLGFRTRCRDDIRTVEGYLAGGLDRRRGELVEMLEDPGVRGVFCARGGYGSGHLLAEIDPSRLRRSAKVFCGASDITMLLAAFARAGVVAFHGPMVATTIRLGPDGYDRDLMMRILVEGEAVEFETAGCRILQPGRGEGRLTGGCLSLIVSTLATDWELDTRDSILVVEDIDARPYQIDRMLTQLRQAGKLDRVRGFVFGEMPGCDPPPGAGYTTEDVIRSCLSDLGAPILYGFPTGHAARPNAVVPFGVEAELSLDSGAAFRMLEAAVARR